MWTQFNYCLVLIALTVFCCHVHSLFENCTQLVQLRTGGSTYIYSPNYPNLYPYGSSCFYNIVAPIDHQLRITCNLQLNVQTTGTCGNETFYYNSEGSELLARSEFFCGNGTIERTSFLNYATLSYISLTSAQDNLSLLVDIRNPQQQTAQIPQAGFNRPQQFPVAQAVPSNDDAVVVELADQLFYDTPAQLLNRKYYAANNNVKTSYSNYHQSQQAATNSRYPSFSAVSDTLSYINSLLTGSYASTTTTQRPLRHSANNAHSYYPAYKWHVAEQTADMPSISKYTKKSSQKTLRVVNNELLPSTGTTAVTNQTAQPGGGVFSCLVEAIGPACTCGWGRAATTTAATAALTAGTINAASLHEFPATAAVMTKSDNTTICGATIIHQRYLLTAAHCYVAEATNHPLLLKVVVGEHDLATTTETNSTRYYDIAKIIRHEHFYATALNIRNDIALLRTAADMQFGRNVGPACLPFRDYFFRPPAAFSQVIVAGWGGITLLGGQQFSVLRKYYLSVVSGAQCKREIGALPFGTFCTFTSLSQYGCQYDSGGAVYASNGERLFIIGITSYGYPCTVNKPSVNTRVSSHIKWIVSKTPEVNYCVR